MDKHTPQEIFDYWNATIARIEKARDQYGDLILPGTYKG
jgi:phosphoenolpyruvate carboxykinase (GTP)